MKTHVIKIGGRVATEESILTAFLKETANRPSEDRIIIVHGGGTEVSEVSKKLGHSPEFIDGVRMTSREEMPVVDMVLAGKMNKYIVRLCYSQGINSVGLSGCDGAIFIGESIAEDKENRTGKIIEVHTELLSVLIEKRYTLVVSSVSMDSDGNALNINADEAALVLAKTLKADTLLFISDIPGVLSGKDIIPFLDGPLIEKHIKDQTIKGGMVPKVRSAAEAVNHGVNAVIIGGYKTNGDLNDLLEKKRGTSIVDMVPAT